MQQRTHNPLLQLISEFQSSLEELQKKFDESNFKSIITKLSKNFLSLDNHTNGFLINRQEFCLLNEVLLKIILNEKLTDEENLDYKAFLKIYLIKTKFKFSKNLLEIIFEKLSLTLDAKEKETKNFSKILSLIEILSNGNSLSDEHYSLKFSGEKNSFLKCEFNNQKEPYRFYLDMDFSFIFHFFVEIFPFKNDKLILISYFNSNSEDGYAIYIKEHILYFSVKAKDDILNFEITNNLKDVINLNSNLFVFSCEKKSKRECSLFFKINKFELRKNIKLINPFKNIFNQELKIFHNIKGDLISFFIIEKIPVQEFLFLLDKSIFSNGISNLSSYNYFLENFENFHVKLMINGFSYFEIKMQYLKIFDNIQSKVFLGNTENIYVQQCDSIDFKNQMMSLNIIPTLFVFFNYIENEQEVTLLIKTISNIFNLKKLIVDYMENQKKNVIKDFLSAIISSNCGCFLNYENLGMMIDILTNLSHEYQMEYFNNFLLSFQLIDKLFMSEDTIKIYFNLLIKNFDSKPEILDLINMDSYLKTYLVFLQSDTYLNNKKAAFMFKLFEFFLPCNKKTKNVDLNPLINYFTFISARRDESIKNSLLVMDMFINHPNIFDKFKESVSNSMLLLLEKINNGELIVLCLKILVSVEKNTDLILSFWRKKFSDNFDKEKIKKIYDIYTQDKKEIINSMSLYKFLLSLIFKENKEPNDVYNENLDFNEKPLFDLFFEISILVEEEVLQKLIQILLIYLKQKISQFLNNINNSNFICWLIVILFKNYKKQTKTPIYDLTNKLLILYISFNLTDFGNFDCLISTIELINYYSQIKKCEDLKLLVLNEIIKELIKKNYTSIEENNLKKFIQHLFKYYFLNLTSKNEKEQNEIQTYSNLSNYLNKIINLNFNTIIYFLLPNNENTLRASKLLTLSTSNVLMSKIKTGGNLNLLKLLVIIIIDLAKFFVKVESFELKQNYFSFFTNFFKKVLFFLETNRKKLKSFNLIILETSLYKMLLFFFGNEKNICFVDEIRDSLQIYKEIPNSNLNLDNINFAKKILYILQNNFELEDCNLDEFFKNFHNKILNKKFYLEELDDSDYDQNLKEFVIEIIGTINENLTEKKLFFDIVSEKKENLDKRNYIIKMIYEKYNNNFKEFYNEYFLEEKIFFQELKNLFYKINKAERNRKGNLFRQSNLAYFQNFDNYSEKHYEYKQEKIPVAFKHNNILTSEYQRPFIKMKAIKYWKKNNFKNYEDILDNYNIEVYFMKKDLKYFTVNNIKDLYIIPSYLVVDRNNGDLVLFSNFIKNVSNSNHVELVKRKEKLHKKYKKIYKISNIDFILDFKFLHKKTGVQIWFKNKTLLLINFEKESIKKEFENMMGEINSDLYQKIGSGEKMFKNNLLKNEFLKENTISNFKYLMLVNIYSSRSYNDYSQYPVFPLVIKSIDSNFEPRDLSKPVGMIGNPKKAKTCKKRYNSMETFNQYPRYHYGSHYSSPAIVLHLLIRMKPYNKGCISIQDGVYDLPDRLFFSIDHLLSNILNEISDVRELLPEIFYFPFIFINKNNFNFGINQNKNRIHNVSLPEYFKQDPYKFVFTMRKILESKEVSEKIGDWIDLIFGYKQTGKEASDAQNVFFYLTYEENINKLEYIDEKTSNANETQIYHFGQVPSKIFRKKHPNKQHSSKTYTLVSVGSEVKYFLKKRDKNLDQTNNIFLIKEIQYAGQNNARNNITKIAVVKSETVEFYKFNNLLGTSSKKIPFEFILMNTVKLSKFSNFFYSHNYDVKFRSSVEIYEKYKIIFGGFNTGEMLVFNLKSMKMIAIFKIHNYKVNKLKLSQTNILLSSDIRGIINISKINIFNNTLENLYTIYDYYGYEIRDLEFCINEEEFFIINSSKMQIEIRTLKNCSNSLFVLNNEFHKLYGKQNEFFAKGLLSFGFISCVVIYSVVKSKNYLHSFAFDGQLIGKYVLDDSEEVRFRKFLIIKDEYFKDNLIICNQYGDLYIFDLPFFDNGRKIKSNQSSEITSMITINKMKTLLIADEKGVIDIFNLLNN